ncbi:MAG: ATP-binding protein, partial [Prevotellaceae bacterium]|nr:ATP-binding protein [Prevotellaceae bacterium]
METIRKMPIGIQDFEDLRENNCVYVDKTEYLYRLVESGAPYFLGRPRRFGKSLFLSTLKAYFLGKKHLFEGLKIAELEKNWIEYPVIYVDMNVENYINIESLYSAFDTNLKPYEEKWGRDTTDSTYSARFMELIRRAHKQEGKKVVVLIDEYDKPLLNTIEKLTINDDIRDELKSFYGALKNADQYLKFVFLTGVTKFSKVSVFSDLNHLVDISMDDDYSGVCGISETEIKAYFDKEIRALAERKKMTYEQTLTELKKQYDGYHFAKDSECIYNPFSLLNTFDKRDFFKYWFATGTPSFLVKMLKENNFDIAKMEKDIKISVDAIADYRLEAGNLVPLLYQSGYLTIKSYDERYNLCTLGYPNEEVKYGFMNELLPVYVPKQNIQQDFHAAYFIEDLRAGDVDAFMNRVRAFFACIPNELNNKTEKHYQTIFYLLFKLMGQFIDAEQRSAAGRADAVVETENTVYVFEFKLDEN